MSKDGEINGSQKRRDPTKTEYSTLQVFQVCLHDRHEVVVADVIAYCFCNRVFPVIVALHTYVCIC